MNPRLHHSAGFSQYIAYTAAFNAARALVQSTVILYLVDVLHLPLAWTGYLLAVDLAVTLLMEIPSGLFADLKGKRRSFLAACGLSVLGTAVYGMPLFLQLDQQASTVLVLATLGEAVLAMAFTFYSGALDAWVVNAALHTQADVGRILASGQAAKNVAFLVAGVAGIFVYFEFAGSRGINTFALATLAMVCTFVHAWCFMQRSAEEQASAHAPTPATRGPARLARRALLAALRSSLQDKRLRQLIVLSSVSFTLLQLLVHFWPYYLSRGAAAQAGGSGSIHQAGMAGLMLSWALAYGARALGNACAGRAFNRPCVAPLLTLAVVAGAGLLAAFSLAAIAAPALPQASAWALVASLFYAAVRFFDGFAEPLRLKLLTDHTVARNRATLYSISSFAGMALSSAGALLAAMVLGSGASVAQIWLAAALLQMASAPAYCALWRKKG